MKTIFQQNDTTVSISPVDEKLASIKKQYFDFEIYHNGQTDKGHGLLSTDYWMPTNKDYGFKLVKNEDCNIGYLKEINSCNFPIIYDYVVGSKYTLIKCSKEESRKSTMSDLDECVQTIYDNQLCPEDEWCKTFDDKGSLPNIFGNKIIDFQRFVQMPERYKLPTKENADLDSVYQAALLKYKARGDNKWKGKIYQGMNFSNGYTMPGYSSDGKIFDSYRKLAFCYMNKAKGENVLDLGCNEGFFSFQAAIHGAKLVDSMDLCAEDIWLASSIYDYLDIPPVIDFRVKNIVDFVKETNRQYNLTFLLSVIHQVFKNFEGATQFLKKLSQITRFLVFETPIHHPLMTLNNKEVFDVLQRHFPYVRQLYQYKAYSKGDRAIYICFREK